MKSLLIVLLSFFVAFEISAQSFETDVFRTHMGILAQHPKITKQFSMIDDEHVFHLYINVDAFEDYYSEQPVLHPGYKVFLWNSTKLTFFEIQQDIRLVTVEQPHKNVVVYEFISQIDHRRFLLQVRFVFKSDKWELSDLKQTRIKMTQEEGDFFN